MKKIILPACLTLVIVSLIVAFGLLEYYILKTEGEIGEQTSINQNNDMIYYNNEQYIPKDRLETLLILGIDKQIGGTVERQNSEQVDFLLLLVLNKKTESFQFLHLNRDTMTQISETDDTNRVIGTYEGQLALSHGYGNSEKVRCRNTVRAVESLLYDVDIQHFLSLTMDAVPILNDSIGGVELQLMDDFTHINENLVKDAIVTLEGEQALAYVQERGSLEDNTNLHRMERQQQYITALLEKLSSYDLENNSDTLMEVSEYLVSDCTIDQLSRMLERMGSYTYEGTVSPAGEAAVGSEFMEYYVDEQALQELVVGMFYEKIN